MSVMLYKSGGKHKIHGGMFDYIVVDEAGVEEKIEEGWALTTSQALEHAEYIKEGKARDDVEDHHPPTREELELKAKELNISFRKNTKNETLLSKINEKLKND